MSITQGLGITLLEARQTQPHIVVNEALTNLDKSVSGRLPIDMTGLATITLSNADCSYLMLNPFDTPTGAFDLIVNGNVKMYLVINDTPNTCTFKSATGTSVTILTGVTSLCYFDGTNMHKII